ncbi:MAG: hypothetical protein QOD92_1287 [Acidimicrobiaceae bacterium]
MVPPTTEADDTDTDESAEVDDAPAVRETRASASRWLVVVGALAVVFALIASVMTASYIRLRSDKDDSNADRTAVATIAARVAEAMTAIDAAGDNKAEADVVHQLGTGPLIDQYDATIPATRQLLLAVKVKSEHGQITPNGVYVGDIEGDQAQVIVVIDLVVIGEITKVVPNQYLRMHLVRLNGDWKVDNVSDINVELAASAGAGASTTTSVPAPSTASSSG